MELIFGGHVSSCRLYYSNRVYVIYVVYLLHNPCGTAFTKFSLSRPTRCMYDPTFFFGGQHCCSRCSARAARTHVEKIKHRSRLGSAFHDTPRRFALLEKGIDHTAGWTETKNSSSVGTQEVAADLAAFALLAMGTNRARHNPTFFLT